MSSATDFRAGSLLAAGYLASGGTARLPVRRHGPSARSSRPAGTRIVSAIRFPHVVAGTLRRRCRRGTCLAVVGVLPSGVATRQPRRSRTSVFSARHQEGPRFRIGTERSPVPSRRARTGTPARFRHAIAPSRVSLPSWGSKPGDQSRRVLEYAPFAFQRLPYPCPEAHLAAAEGWFRWLVLQEAS